jgi:hypothetical protein
MKYKSELRTIATEKFHILLDLFSNIKIKKLFLASSFKYVTNLFATFVGEDLNDLSGETGNAAKINNITMEAK